MKTRILAVTFIAILFSFFTLFDGTAQSGSDPAILPVRDATPTKPVKRTKPPNPTGALSDLKVDHVWLDPQNRINFRLRNAGNDTMPDEEHKGGIVRVVFGKSHEDFYLGKASAKKDPVDPIGTLKKVGRSLAYNTKIVLTERFNVKVYVDGIHGIAMADRRKGKSLTLLPLIATKPKFEEAKKPGEGLIDSKPKIEEEKKPGDYLLKEVLVVRDIYRDPQDCKLVVVVANEGTSEIPEELYGSLYLFVRKTTANTSDGKGHCLP